MIEELREATSLESNDPGLHGARLDLRELTAGVVYGMDDERGRRITVETDDGASYWVFADASRLERVVANLITNALKYSAEDTPVNVRISRQGPNNMLEVSDRGIGIAPESVTMLFERYYRTPAGKTRASGLGLGLYIARLIVEARRANRGQQ